MRKRSANVAKAAHRTPPGKRTVGTEINHSFCPSHTLKLLNFIDTIKKKKSTFLR
ncbi:hypothetical protein [Lysinibacillus xylanilyticus]|uniref:hypothetical protein n=1 Tax=Lysinibacillus xylanilyticus TaxID=582475 RepID=UPI003CFBDC04